MPAGRPLKFESVEELEKKIQEYFESCTKEEWTDIDERDEEGNFIYEDVVDEKDPRVLGKVKQKHIKRLVFWKPISVTGLAVALDTTRETLLDYQENAEFSDTIKKAKQFIENYVEEGLLGGKINPAAGIFNLKNNWKRWKDEMHQVTVPGELTDEQKKKMDDLLTVKKPDEGNQPTGTNGNQEGK